MPAINELFPDKSALPMSYQIRLDEDARLGAGNGAANTVTGYTSEGIVLIKYDFTNL